MATVVGGGCDGCMISTMVFPWRVICVVFVVRAMWMYVRQELSMMLPCSSPLAGWSYHSLSYDDVVDDDECAKHAK